MLPLPAGRRSAYDLRPVVDRLLRVGRRDAARETLVYDARVGADFQVGDGPGVGQNRARVGEVALGGAVGRCRAAWERCM